MIHCSYPFAQYDAHRDAIDQAIRRALESGWYILGEEVAAFESEFARYCGAAHCVGVASGTEAIALALMGMGIGRGDEVITVSHTAVATAAAIEQAGATPVLIDVEMDRYTLDPAGLAGAMTPRVKAIVAVHLYGQPADMVPIMDFARTKGLKVVEDCAQAHGALYRGTRVGSIGDAGCFSFFPTKNLGALGDGGGIVTSDAELAQKIRQLREYGWPSERISAHPGINSRLDVLQAAILRAKLPHLDRDNAARARIASRYGEQLKGLNVVLPAAVPETSHVYHQYVIRTERRDALVPHLREQGIVAGIHYPQAVHQQPAYRDRLPRRSDLRNTEALLPQIVSLPIYPELTDEQVARVSAAVRAFVDG
jgi:dTDP-4-amino-4,6-dideoxygalactose transaminase